MPKKKPESKLISGYSAWSNKRLMNEAVNVSRWNPWLAHEWMHEATRGLSIVDQIDLIDHHDAAADKINKHWKMLTRMKFYDAKTFWDGLPPKMIKKIISDDEYDIV